MEWACRQTQGLTSEVVSGLTFQMLLLWAQGGFLLFEKPIANRQVVIVPATLNELVQFDELEKV